jgi:hypothetical protein
VAGDERSISKISVPIVTDTSGFSKGLNKARKDGEKFSQENRRNFSVMGTGIKDSLTKVTDKLHDLGKTNIGMVTQGLAGMAVAAAASAAAIATIGFKHITDLGKDALALGVSADALSRLRAVARASGTDVGDLSEFVKGLTGDINASINKTTSASEAFKALGTSAEDLAKMTPDEQIAKLNKGFAALPNDAERAKVAMQLAGQNGVKMFRMLAMGTKDFQDAFQNAPIVTDDDVSEIRKLQIAIDKIAASVQSLADLFTAKVAPAITSVADMLAGFASKFGVAVATVKAPSLPTGQPKAPAVQAVDQSRLIAQQKAQADKRAEAIKAQAEAAKLQERFDKQAAQIAGRKPSYVPSTNGSRYQLSKRDQAMRDRHAQTGGDLNAAKAKAERLANEAKSGTQAMTDAMRLNQEMMKQVAELKQEYRTTIEGAGKDDVHRRVDQIKGLSESQRKDLLKQGYQSREAGKQSALRDELQESTKLPIEKLREDLARINKLVALGPANGGLTRLQGIRAAAQKTADSGVAGGQPRYAGALQANSLEGRSYLLSQVMRTDDPVAIARQGLALTGQSNNLLGGILNQLMSSSRDMVASI